MVLDEKKWKRDAEKLGNDTRNGSSELYNSGKKGARIGYDPNK